MRDLNQSRPPKPSFKELIIILVNGLKSSPALVLTLFGGMVSKMHTTLAITFMLLWVNSFINPEGSIQDEEDAKQAYVYLNIACGIVAFINFFPIGKACDGLSPKVITPISFVLFAGSLTMVYPITDPLSIYSFLTWCMITFSGLFVGVAVSAYYSKILPKEGRGIFIGIYGLMDLLG
mmetsp:Transcript_1784/g.1704  ORF Transcript_1784/g.1704 Transcript_1784/m.1704 type:complete len:178 (+) Transcript_1784:385-918(+)